MLSAIASLQSHKLFRDSSKLHEMPYRHPRPEQHGIGAPSIVGATGAAIAVYAQNKPTIRHNILTARVIDCFS